jgi:galactosylceramidase
MNPPSLWRISRLCIPAILLLAHAVFAAPAQAILLDGTAPGKSFDGVGAVSGGGGTSVLLKDYPQPQRDQILDILFKPKFAAAMQTLYVEVGSDANSTQGSEPTHMRSRDDQNYFRGYEWWLMSQAKRRNPALTLDACAWGCPGWIGNGDFWSQDMADYYVNWIKGLKTNHDLDLDAVGCRNERGTVTRWVKLFRKTLDANGLSAVRIHAFDNPGNKYMWDWIPELDSDPQLARSVDIVANHTLLMGPMPPSVRQTLDRLHKPLWNTEEHVYNGEGRFFADDFDCALAAVHFFNDDFISRGATKIVNWYLAGSTYGIQPYADQPPALIARSPWSGHYSIKPIIWAYAHYGQFTQIGWHYLPGGCAALDGGGTVVTLRADDGNFSIIAETAGATRAQQVTFRAVSGLSSHPLCVWRTTRDAQFVRLTDITPSADGAFTVTFEPNAIYSLSTTTGQQKGTFADVPSEKPFPFPYFDNFDHYGDARRWGYLPHFTADVAGVFEIADRPDHAGKCLRQVVTDKAQSWAPEWMPYTILGDPQWTDYQVSADIFLDDGGWAGVMGRITSTGNGWDCDPNGYYARLYPDGGCALYLASDRFKGSRERQLALGAAENWKWNTWHNLKLRFANQSITVLVDDSPVIQAHDAQFSHGLAGLITAGEGNARHSALFANLLINDPNAAPVPPTIFPQDSAPLYP